MKYRGIVFEWINRRTGTLSKQSRDIQVCFLNSGDLVEWDNDPDPVFTYIMATSPDWDGPWYCAMCGTKMKVAPGIGPYCPKMKCANLDGPCVLSKPINTPTRMKINDPANRIGVCRGSDDRHRAHARRKRTRKVPEGT